MADVKATVVYQPGDSIFGRVTLAKITAADDIQIGDFLKSTGATGVEKLAAVTDDATFVGVSGMLSEDADGPSNLLVYTQCIIEVPVVSAAYNFGAGLKYNVAGGALEADAAFNTIAWAWETKGAGTTSLKVLVDVLLLAKLFPVSA